MRGDEVCDSLQIGLGDRRIPRTNRLLELCARRRTRIVERNELEQTVYGVSDLGPCQHASLFVFDNGVGAGNRRQPDDPFGEVAIRAAFEERQRAVRELPNVVCRRRGQVEKRRELEADGSGTQGELAEERELDDFGLLG